MNSAICTLFEGDYHFGVGALTNSLYTHGFRGPIWVGFRGSLPPWATEIKSKQNYLEFCFGENCAINFVSLATTKHLASYKADFMSQIWEFHDPQADALFYFDPDITIRGRWSFFEEWVQHGIAMCEDSVYGHMPSSHPFRIAWKKFAEHKKYSCQRELNDYFNSGFVGFSREHKSALLVWKNLLDDLTEVGIASDAFKPGDRSHPFFGTDQDTLNLMAMITHHPLSTIGLEGMDFAPGGYTMSHAATTPKPWRKRFTQNALAGFAPTMADKEFLSNTQSPICLYPPSKRKLLMLDVKVAAAIGRFIRRS